MPDNSISNSEAISNNEVHAPIPREIMDRDVKISRKAAFWVIVSAGTLAFVMFSLLFLHAAARNHWGPFGS